MPHAVLVSRVEVWIRRTCYISLKTRQETSTSNYCEKRGDRVRSVIHQTFNSCHLSGCDDAKDSRKVPYITLLARGPNGERTRKTVLVLDVMRGKLKRVIPGKTQSKGRQNHSPC